MDFWYSSHQLNSCRQAHAWHFPFNRCRRRSSLSLSFLLPRRWRLWCRVFGIHEIETLATQFRWELVSNFLNFKKPLKHFSFLGITVSAIGLCAGLPTGASMNPARSFGPALWNWNWDYHWVYWVAPMLGSTLAGLFYRGVFWKKNPKDEALQPVVEETETETSNKWNKIWNFLHKNDFFYQLCCWPVANPRHAQFLDKKLSEKF